MPPSAPQITADALADEPLGGWRGALLRMGLRRAVVTITAVSVGLSLFVTWSAGVVLGGPGAEAVDFAVAIAVPLMVAPLVSGAAMGLLHEVEAARRALHHVAIRDGLTNLYNRRFFMARLETEVNRAQRHATPLSMLMVDIDHFKLINDRRGHAIGDQVLERVASVLIAGLRPYDVSARYGGEEFVALLPGASPEEAVAAAERIRGAIGGLHVPAFDDTPLPHVTASLGIASLGLAPESASALLSRADQAMYLAKSGGRNRWVRLPQPSVDGRRP